MKLRLVLGVLVLGLATACGGGDDSSSGSGGGGGGSGDNDSGTVKVTLEEQNGSGRSGTAELFPGAASTDLTLEINGTSDNDPIYVRSGTCDAPGKEVVHDVGFTTANLGQGQIFETIDQVATGEYILSVEDGKTTKPIMCGQIPEQ
ncbi:MAG TPA: hypothetical protein VFO03_11945 [Gaiellaceae bacterium]|nr:hypothetical protein [Gaiellaceae bacterium]